MGELLLEARQVSFSYERPVLQEISLQLYAGEVLGVVGPNGAGKTTLLSLLYGRLRPQQGEILLYEPKAMGSTDHPADRCVAGLEAGDAVSAKGKPAIARSLSHWRRQALAQRIGIVRQDTSIGLPITVGEYVMQGRYPYLSGFGFESDGDVRIVDEILRRASLESLVQMDAQAISGGERQRMLLARALAQKPRLLLLDEPTANLDVKYQLETLAWVRRLTRELNMGTLMVTHDLNLISEFADRLVLLKEGRVVCSGAVQDVVTSENIFRVFEVDVLVDRNPASGCPRISHKTPSRP